MVTDVEPDDPISAKVRHAIHILKQREIQLSRNSLQQQWAEIEAEHKEWEWVKATRKRLRFQYGQDGLELIARVVDKTYYYKPHMTEAQRWNWAESKYARGEVLC